MSSVNVGPQIPYQVIDAYKSYMASLLVFYRINRHVLKLVGMLSLTAGHRRLIQHTHKNLELSKLSLFTARIVNFFCQSSSILGRPDFCFFFTVPVVYVV